MALAIVSPCPYRKSNPDVVMMESSEQWDGLVAQGDNFRLQLSP